jgi:hypothetical protein
VTPKHTFWFRNNILFFASILAAQAAWLITAELSRPKLPYFPQDKASEQKVSAARFAAVSAASIGWVRGDLWTDAAIALSSGLTGDKGNEINPEMTISKADARAVAQRAARLSPHDSRTWLLLAALDSRFDWPNEIANRLMMSYFTGPNEPALTPLRIRIATRLTAFTAPDLKMLIEQEIRGIILRHQDQKPLLLDAYRDASPEGKQLIEVSVGDLDKNLLAAIRAISSRQ